MYTAKDKFNKRKRRVRNALSKRAYGKLRLSVFRSDNHIYAQLIDDSRGHTLVSASTVEKEVLNDLKVTSNIEAAARVGGIVAQRAIKLIKDDKLLNIIFDRGGYIYHGRIKALADAARKEGLKF